MNFGLQHTCDQITFDQCNTIITHSLFWEHQQLRPLLFPPSSRRPEIHCSPRGGPRCSCAKITAFVTFLTIFVQLETMGHRLRSSLAWDIASCQRARVVIVLYWLKYWWKCLYWALILLINIWNHERSVSIAYSCRTYLILSLYQSDLQCTVTNKWDRFWDNSASVLRSFPVFSLGSTLVFCLVQPGHGQLHGQDNHNLV